MEENNIDNNENVNTVEEMQKIDAVLENVTNSDSVSDVNQVSANSKVVRKKITKKEIVIIVGVVIFLILGGLLIWKVAFSNKNGDEVSSNDNNQNNEVSEENDGDSLDTDIDSAWVFMHFSVSSLTMKTNQQQSLEEIMRLRNIEFDKIDFESSDTNMVTIEDGKIVSKYYSGTATITAKYGSLESKLIVDVEYEIDNSLVDYMEIKQKEYYIYVGESLDVKYDYYPIEATDIDFSWISSNTSIFTTKNNRITGKKVGKATLTLKNNKVGCDLDFYDCTDNVTATVYVVNSKITFEYLDNNQYKNSYEIIDTDHEEYVNTFFENDDYAGLEKAKYTKDFTIRVTLTGNGNMEYTNDDLTFDTNNIGGSSVNYTYIGKDGIKENAYLYKVSYTFEESKAYEENHSDTTFKLPDGSEAIFRVYSDDAYYCYNACKPILYLYPLKTSNVYVNLRHPSYITTSYPKYNKGWFVNVDPKGNMIDSNGKSYYALYWDEKYYASKNNKIDFRTGFYVESENAIEFLEEKLSYIGLNDREKNEFIMYWLPILEKNKKSLVYFELTNERETNNKIYINPAPDSLLRVIIHVKKVDRKFNIKEQKLVSFNRHGFAAIEWGGVNH